MKKGIDYPGVSVCCLCHDSHGKYVLLKRGPKARDEHGNWDLIAGGVEFDETIEETIRHEVEEELDTEVLDYKFLGFRDVHRQHQNQSTHWIALDFLVQINPARVKINEPHKFEDIGWFELGKFPQPLHSQFPKFFDQYLEKLKSA